MKFKICGMRDPGNIREVGELKPDYMGFIFYPKSSRYAGADLSRSVLEVIPAATKKVGVFVNAPRHVVVETTTGLGLNAIQLHGEEPPDYCESLRFYGPVIKAFGVDEEFDFDQLVEYKGVCSYFLFDTKTPGHGGSGQTFNWNILSRYKGTTPFFLSGGIGFGHRKTIEQLGLELPALHGIDLNSKFETTPGMKDAKKLKRMITAFKP